MRGALMLTAARAPYRRAGLAFAAGEPLTVAVLALTVAQLRLLLTDDAITILVGQDNGGFVKYPELTAELTDEQLQTWIDTAPAIDLGDIAAPVAIDADVETMSVTLARTREALDVANAKVSELQDGASDSAAALVSAHEEIAARDARIVELSDQAQAVTDQLKAAQARIVELEKAVASTPKHKAKPAAE